MGVEFFLPIKTAANITDKVIVGFSGGKDSAVTLDICFRYFKKIYPFFMYLVPGLSFQEATLRWYEKRYNIEILRIPHPMLSTWLRWGVFRKQNLERMEITFRDIYHYVRVETDCWWIAGGERIADSIVRRAMIKRSGTVDDKRGRFYPVGFLKKKDILIYTKNRRLKMTPEYNLLGHSFRGLDPDDMVKIQKIFPEDFLRIKEMFPFVEAGCVKIREAEKRAAEKQVSEI